VSDPWFFVVPSFVQPGEKRAGAVIVTGGQTPGIPLSSNAR
jgi:hypothetical protein